MLKEQTIKCAFCQGTGENPHFTGSCPVCKGRGKNQIRGKVASCRDCRGSGQKGGTTLTCFACGGLGVVPDTRETFRRAREEIREAQEEMVREREELREKPMIKITEKSKKHKLIKRGNEEDRWEEEKAIEESGGKTHFCQCCGNELNESVNIRICFDCFSKVKELRAYKEI